MRHRLNRHAGSLALVACVMATLSFCVVGASAAKRLITGSQIKNGTITTLDVKNNNLKSADLGTESVKAPDLATEAVTSPDLATEAVTSPDLANEAVTSGDVANNTIKPTDVELPESTEITKTNVGSAMIEGETFAPVYTAGTDVKESSESEYEITWVGSAEEGEESPIHSPCVFQLRVDGSAQGGGGEVFVQGRASVSVSAVFNGLPSGPHQVEVWARHAGPSTTSCTVGPASLGIDQTFIANEGTG